MERAERTEKGGEAEGGQRGVKDGEGEKGGEGWRWWGRIGRM